MKPLTENSRRTLCMLAEGVQRPKYPRGDGGWFMAFWSLHGRGFITDEGRLTKRGQTLYASILREKDDLDAVIARCVIAGG